MSTFILLLLASLLALIGVAGARSGKAGKRKLEKEGTLGLGTVRHYDSDDLVTVEFFPDGAIHAVAAMGPGHFLKQSFPPGARMAVLYNPLSPAVNAISPEQADAAIAALGSGT